MFKSIFSIVAFSAVLAGQLIFAPLAEARRCDEEPPKTLLDLYRKSTEIHVARYEGSYEVGILDSGEDFTVVELSKRYTVTSTLKGPTRASFVMDDQEYRYTGEDAAEPEAEDAHRIVVLAPGDTVMLFLKAGETPGSAVLADYADAVKPMSGEKLASYEKRVSELNSLFASGQPSDAKLVDWILGAIEDPHTRWEGAFELLTGLETLEWKAERERSIQERRERGETIEDWELEDLNYQEFERFDNTPYARILSEKQKHQLLELLLSVNEAAANSNGDTSSRKMSEGDRVLIDLVGRWGDDRMADMLLGEISGELEHGWVRAKYMDRVAKILGDAEARAIVSMYENIYYLEDEDAVEADVVGPAVDRIKTVSDTYGKLKSELVASFAERCRTVLATKQAETSS